MFYSFDDYWKKFGSHYDEVTSRPDLELIFYSVARKIWRDAGGTDDETYEFAHMEGYECCERENNLIPKEDK